GILMTALTPHPGSQKPLIGVTMGDPAGIGPEVVVKALADPEVRALGRFLIFGIDECLYDAAEQAGIKPFWFRVSSDQASRIDSGVVVADFDDFAGKKWRPPRPRAEGGAASLAFVDAAIEAAKGGAIDAIATAPIHKTSWKLAGCRFPGHTEKLADACKCNRFAMAFVGGGLRIALASVHVGLFELRNRFNLGMVFTPIDLLHRSLTGWFGLEHPRIAVAGLNPHAGEDGLFGDEEARVIEPAMQMARNAGIDVEGPFPADTLFTPRMRTRFDGIVAMYHDQGLIPIKMLAFDTAVNLTLGLPIIRTSVDHGTAFDIAHTSRADATSMKEAIRLACDLSRQQAATWSEQKQAPNSVGKPPSPSA
ncbi:MAG: 4-hydroxythreonine-4-phosphate dehydrogenase PdxA, partial [Phycisphaerae bacterium]